MSWILCLFHILTFVCWKSNGFVVKQWEQPRQSQLFELSIVHLNDFHANFVQTSPESGICRKDEQDQCIGGLGRLMTVARQLLKERKNPIFLNAGDHYQGSMWYNVFKWNATAHFMNILPHDAMTIGNHDFDDGVAGLVPFLQKVRAPVVVTNIDDSEEPTIQGLYKNSTTIVRDGRSIGVIGVITQSTTEISKPGKVHFLDQVDSVNEEAERLKAQGVNMIIVLSHVGLDDDRMLAANCPEIDVIVGGHSHTLLYSGEPPSTGFHIDEYPVVVKQNSTNRTVLIVQASAYTKYLGNLTVWFDRQGEVADWQGNPVFLANSIQEDAEMVNELKPWAQEIDPIIYRQVGETLEYLNRSCHSGECNMANLITDGMVDWYENKSDEPHSWTYASIGCMNAAGMRTDIPAGRITFGDLSKVLPFEDSCDVVELQGKHLYHALEESVSGNEVMLHWSGIRVVYNMSMPAWSRIQSLSIRCQACKLPKYEPLEHEKWYRIIAIAYVIEGGSGLTAIANSHRNRQQGPIIVNTAEQYVKSISPFTYQLDRRVQFVQ